MNDGSLPGTWFGARPSGYVAAWLLGNVNQTQTLKRHIGWFVLHPLRFEDRLSFRTEVTVKRAHVLVIIPAVITTIIASTIVIAAIIIPTVIIVAVVTIIVVPIAPVIPTVSLAVATSPITVTVTAQFRY